MEIKISIELDPRFYDTDQKDCAKVNIIIKSMPIYNKGMVGQQLEKLIQDQFQAAMKLAYRDRAKKSDEPLNDSL